jgi:prevent-host-death family protein
MIKETPAVTLRQNLGEVLNEVQYRKDSVVITRDGKPVAALVDMELFEKIRSFRDEFELMVKELSSTYTAVDPRTATKEIDEAVRAARGSKNRTKKR